MRQGDGRERALCAAARRRRQRRRGGGGAAQRRAVGTVVAITPIKRRAITLLVIAPAPAPTRRQLVVMLDVLCLGSVCFNFNFILKKEIVSHDTGLTIFIYLHRPPGLKK